MDKLKQFLYETMEDEVSDRLSHKIFESFITTLIILNVISIVLESIKIIPVHFFIWFENVSVSIFTIEFILRLLIIPIKSHKKGWLYTIGKQTLSPMGIIDLLSILPFYLQLILKGINFPDARVLRLLRLIRILRILKLTRYLNSFKLIVKVIKSRKHELFITGYIAVLLLLIASTLMFEIENDAQPDKFPNILAALWWAIATLTTIGYGDIFPITDLGKILSALISLFGIGIVALPTGIISSGFIEEFRIHKEQTTQCVEKKICPHCKKEIT